MLGLSLVTIGVFIVAPWAVISGKLYRRPLLLSLLGVFVAFSGAYFSYVLGSISETPPLSEVFPYADFAAHLVGVTISAAGGSLIASGFVLLAQYRSVTDRRDAECELDRAKERIDQLEQAKTALYATEDHLTTQEIEDRKDELAHIEVRSQRRLKKAISRARECGIDV